ncbi:MAG: hypothetical protein E6R03_15205 [Hyphomicrobiaceae bacterium]|nr:MAG: hypothetical protein E6R03_15205 [Hyphomicrobiaceae bacterium]
MKVLVTKESHRCDVCNTEVGYPTVCLRCNKECCWDCEKTQMVTYHPGVHFCGTNDGHYCKDCDKTLIASGTDKRHKAYRAIKSLVDEANGWHADFNKRKQEAEETLGALLEDND